MMRRISSQHSCWRFEKSRRNGYGLELARIGRRGVASWHDFLNKEGEFNFSTFQSTLPTAEGFVDIGSMDADLARMVRDQALKFKKEQAYYQRRDRAESVLIPPNPNAKMLSNLFQCRTVDILKQLIRLGYKPTGSSDTLPPELVDLLCAEFRFVPQRRESPLELHRRQRARAERQASEERRAPVVTVMGHVNHGKTSLLDAFRRSNVVSKESGGITQHVGAFVVDVARFGGGHKSSPSHASSSSSGHGSSSSAESGSEQWVTFLDTPGHAAFSGIRSRGAQLTDLVILVVAADEGLMLQTQEALEHVRRAGVPFVVALTKMDKKNADADAVMQELYRKAHVNLEEYGGDVPCVPISAVTGQGLGDLLDAVLLRAEEMELTARPTTPAVGTVIETSMSKAHGRITKVLVRDGSLAVHNYVVSGTGFARVRGLLDERGKHCVRAGPSTPIEILGFKDFEPQPGMEFSVVEDQRAARDIVQYRKSLEDATRLHSRTMIRMEGEDSSSSSATASTSLSKEHGEGGETSDDSASSRKIFNVVLKGDVSGSLEALRSMVDMFPRDEVAVQVVASGVGPVTDSDVILASTAGALVVGFNVPVSWQVRETAKHYSVPLESHPVIYTAIECIRTEASKLLPPRKVEDMRGQAEVRAVFAVRMDKGGRSNVAGCLVTNGSVLRKCLARVRRNGAVVFEGAIESLRRIKDDVPEVKKGLECGLRFRGFDEVLAGDTIECFTVREEPRKLPLSAFSSTSSYTSSSPPPN